MIYRAWDYEDILRVSELEAQCFGKEKWTYAMFASSFMQSGFFSALCESEEKELIGYGCVQCAIDEADLLNVAVSPAYRRQGVGKTLLKRLILGAKRRGIKKLFLEVRASNASAQALYTGEGFTFVAERKKYYPDGESALVMVKEL